MNNLAPIVLFVYNRPDHTKKTLAALQKNILAQNSELFIYSDAAKSEAIRDDIYEVQKLISEVSGFKKVTVLKQEKNIGLANSIINGVTEIVNKYGKVIVIEDDLVTSPYFLTYMNDALCLYANKKSVWHVSGWNYPIATSELDDTFFWGTMNCWGWATWSDRWSHFDKKPKDLLTKWSRQDIKKFNLGGATNFWEQVEGNISGRLNTWAIFWYATIFENDGLCLNPTNTLVKNIGHDGSGENCGTEDIYSSALSKNMPKLTSVIAHNQLAQERIIEYYQSLKTPLYLRVINKVKRLFK